MFLEAVLATATGLVGVVFILIVYSSAFTVQFGHIRILTRFGKIIKILRPGVHFKIPLVDQFAGRKWISPTRVEQNGRVYSKWVQDIPIMEIRHDPPQDTYLMKDSQAVTVDLNFYSQIINPEEAIQCSDIWDGLETVIDVATVAVCQQYGTETSLWDNLSAGIRTNKDVAEFCKRYGILVTRVEVQSVKANADIITARTETAKKLREFEFTKIQRDKQAEVDEQRMKHERSIGLLQHQKMLEAQAAEAKLKQQKAEDDAVFVMTTLKHEAERHAANVESQRSQLKLASERTAAEVSNKLALAKAEAEATKLNSTAKMEGILTHLKDLTSEAQSQILTAFYSTYYAYKAVRKNSSIHTVNFYTSGIHPLSMAMTSPYAMQHYHHQQQGGMIGTSSAALQMTNSGGGGASSAKEGGK